MDDKYKTECKNFTGDVKRDIYLVQPNTIFIKEPGLYSLIFRSNQKLLKMFDNPNTLAFKMYNEYDLPTKVVSYIKRFYYIDTDEIPGFFLLLKNHIFIVRSEDTIFIFHV